MIQVFDFNDYQDYLKAAVSDPSQGRHGVQSRLAEALGCQSSHISKVLSGTAQLSLEQADLANSFFGNTSEQSDYFITLVEKGRAGTDRLRQHFERKLQALREQHFSRAVMKGSKRLLDESGQIVFYSSWLHSAVHASLSIPALQTPEAIARRLKVPLTDVAEVLDFLVSVGLASKKPRKEGEFLQINNRTHLSRTSPLIYRHHVNWRVQALRSLDRKPDTDLHYSAVITLSKDDVFKIKAVLIEAIEKANAIIAPSKEEQLFGLCLDFFEL